MVWDRGTYQVFGDDSVQALEQGKIHFVLAGKKLKGEWTLVRMRQGEASKPQWLLLKSGEDMSPLSVRAENHSAVTGRSLEQIAEADGRQWQSNRASRSRNSKLGKSRPVHPTTAEVLRSRSQVRHEPVASALRTAGARQSTRGHATGQSNTGIDLNTLPNAKARFVEPMKALLVDRLPKGSDWLYEIKFDGVRALALKHGKSLSLISRSGKDLGLKYSSVLQALKDLKPKQLVLDGEVVAVDEQGRSAFQLLQSYQTAAAKPPLFYYAFDILQLDGRDLTAVPLWRRKEILQYLIDNHDPTLRFSDNIQADSARLMKEMQARGLEGLVAKKRESPYEPGRRSGAWVKFKWTNEQEFVIGGFTQPKGARSHFGAILVGYYEKGQLRFAAKVGTGFDEATLELLYRKFQKLVQPECPFMNLPEKSSGMSAGLSRAEMNRCTWVRPELVCQVRFAEWTRDNHLRQPAFLGLREDKEPREVVREKPA